MARDSADAHWAHAIVGLMAPESRSDASTAHAEELKQVIALDSTQADVHNDLAVAYVARAAASGDAWTLLLGLDEIERAHHLDSTASLIAFNRAVILSKMHLTNEAEAAWNEFLPRSPGSDWSVEASGRLAQVRRALVVHRFNPSSSDPAATVRSDPQVAREYAIDSLLPRWASAQRRGDQGRATQDCALLNDIATQLLSRSNDFSVTSVGHACVGNRGDVAEAALRAAEGGTLFRRGQFDAAFRALDAAAVQLRRLGAPAAAGWAEISLGFVHMYAGRYAKADSTFERVSHEARSRGDSALLARAFWGLGLSAARQGRTEESVDRYNGAAKIFRELGEYANEGVMVAQVADPLLALGRDDEAIAAKYQSLLLNETYRDERARPAPIVAFGLELVELGYPAAAIAVLKEAVRVAVKSERPNDRPEALIQLASAELIAGREAEGRRHLAEARGEVRRLKDPLMLERLTVSLDLVAALPDTLTAPDSAIARLTRVDEYYDRTGLFTNRAIPLARLGRLYWRKGDVSAAGRNITNAVAAIERDTVAAREPTTARIRADAEREVYATLVALALATNDTVRAFLAAERARGNVLDAPPTFAAGRIGLSYFVLPDRLLTWVVSSSGLRMMTTPMPAQQLDRRVDSLEALARIGDTSDGWNAASKEMFDILIRPVEREVAMAQEVVIVPDAALERVPFAALRDSAGRYFVERVSIVQKAGFHSPSSTLGGLYGKSLIVGQPAHDPRVFPGLAALPGAAAEVGIARNALGKAVVLSEASATKRAVTEALQTATVFHFAGHAELVDRAPMLSHLVLASDPSGTLAASVLSAGEIETMDLRRLQLVVLSSCGTLQARSRVSSTQSGLSASFLGAGAHAVISSRWEIDDGGTEQLMSGFYQALSAGDPPAMALRRAQTRLIRDSSIQRPLAVWSAFRYEER